MKIIQDVKIEFCKVIESLKKMPTEMKIRNSGTRISGSRGRKI